MNNNNNSLAINFLKENNLPDEAILGIIEKYIYRWEKN